MPVGVVGLGDPVTDIICHVSHEFLSSVTTEPGGSSLVGKQDAAALLASLGTSSTVTLPGGSAANVLRSMARFNNPEAGDQCCLAGGVGADAAAERYQALLSADGVAPRVVVTSADEPSAVSICLVTPDGQRTMRTCLGAATLFEAAHLPASALDCCTLLHCEGYCLFRPAVLSAAIARAKAAGALVSLDLASFEVVRGCGEALMRVLRAGGVDVLVCNEDEARAVATTLMPGLVTPDSDGSFDAVVEAVQRELLRYCRLVICTLGARGARAQSADGATACATAPLVDTVDTVGAGDYFCGAFLAAHLRGVPLQRSLEIGCRVGSAVVRHVGAQLPADAWAELLRELRPALARERLGGPPLGCGPGARWPGASVSDSFAEGVHSSGGSDASCATAVEDDAGGGPGRVEGLDWREGVVCGGRDAHAL